MWLTLDTVDTLITWRFIKILFEHRKKKSNMLVFLRVKSFNILDLQYYTNLVLSNPLEKYRMDLKNCTKLK